MSRDRGNRAAAWVAEFVASWWPGVERTANGRSGADLEGTPGVAFEIKTGATWRNEWLEQAAKYAAQNCGCPTAETCDHRPELPVLLYLPPGMGKQSVRYAHAVLPLHLLMQVLSEAGYAPERVGM